MIFSSNAMDKPRFMTFSRSKRRNNMKKVFVSILVAAVVFCSCFAVKALLSTNMPEIQYIACDIAESE